MTPEKMFHELLGLGMNWEVIESRFEKESGTVFLEIREREELWEGLRCPKDGGRVFCYDHTEVLTWRHLNVFQHRCEITCRLPRGKCRQCGHIFRVRPPWEGLSMHFTKEFEAFALVLMREMPMVTVAEVMGVTDMRLWRMLIKQVDQAYAEADFSNVCCVGVDELNVRKGHEYLSVFADLVAKRVLFATEGKDKEVWLKFVEALEKHNGHRHSITQASMDMSRAYQSGVAENCRNAQVVFAPQAGEARWRFRVWCRWVKWVARRHPQNIFRAMSKVADMILKHLKGIIAHWKWGITNAFMEGLNSLFQATKRKARGYRSSVYFTTILYFIAGKLRLPQF